MRARSLRWAAPRGAWLPFLLPACKLRPAGGGALSGGRACLWDPAARQHPPACEHCRPIHAAAAVAADLRSCSARTQQRRQQHTSGCGDGQWREAAQVGGPLAVHALDAQLLLGVAVQQRQAR